VQACHSKVSYRWNFAEIFEFDATEDPPATLDVEVFDYDGPFSEPETLGHAEINFVRTGLSDLSDVWIPLDGKIARAHGSKLHLRVFLSNTRDSDALPDYLERVEREVGLKVCILFSLSGDCQPSKVDAL